MAVLAILAALAGTGCGPDTRVPGAPAAGPTTAVVATTATTAPPTTVAPTTTAAPLPLAGRTVVLDPGHNGGNAQAPAVVNAPVPAGRGRTKPCNTTGSETNAGYPEHAFNWDVALRTRERLTALGATVVLTRDSDTGVGPCVDRRAAIGNEHAADAVVSIHADGAGPGDRGFHVAYSDPPLNDAQRGAAVELARAVRDAMAAAGLRVSDYRGDDGLDGRDDLGGLNLADRPSVLVECANLRNAEEAALVSSADGRATYAAAIAAGIAAHLGA